MRIIKTTIQHARTPTPRFSNDVPDLVREIGNEFTTHRVDEPVLKAELLVGHVLGVRRLALYLDRNRVLDEPELKRVGQGMNRILAGEPIQYVLGETDFMGYVYKTDRRALIPRPETEELVKAVLDCHDVWHGFPSIADVGTGTGCIVITLAIMHPEGQYLATDISSDAIELARENARRLPITFVQTNLLARTESESLDAVVSNPPYVASATIAGLDPCIRDHEPVSALDGGPSGTEIIARLVPEAARTLKPGGRIFLEIGEDQSKVVRSILRDVGFHKVHVSRDMAGHERIATGVKG
ncbi:MAG: peptide chain release factor N(5)-glutamine methyltransferase [bacterium]